MDAQPTRILEREHGYIQRVVAALVRQTVAIEAGEAPDLVLLERAVDFLRTYSERYHHAKEEGILFPLLEERGAPATGCPLVALKHDHVVGHGVVNDLADAVAAGRAGRPGPVENLLRPLHTLTDLYPGHIWREDYLLFPMMQRTLSEADMEELTRLFEETDHDMGRAVLWRCEAFSDEVAG